MQIRGFSSADPDPRKNCRIITTDLLNILISSLTFTYIETKYLSVKYMCRSKDKLRKCIDIRKTVISTLNIKQNINKER